MLCKRLNKDIELKTHLEYRKEAMNLIIKHIQNKYFNRELSLLSDANGIIRVGGRLTEGDMPEEAKHPSVLPYERWAGQIIGRSYS